MLPWHFVRKGDGRGGRGAYIGLGAVGLVVCRLADILPLASCGTTSDERGESVVGRGRGSGRQQGNERLHLVDPGTSGWEVWFLGGEVDSPWPCISIGHWYALYIYPRYHITLFASLSIEIFTHIHATDSVGEVICVIEVVWWLVGCGRGA
jgi:hypothetical protein